MNSVDKKALSSALLKWASDDIGFRSVQAVSAGKMGLNLLAVCKRRVMMKLWDHVINHVKSKRYAQDVRDNLTLDSLNDDALLVRDSVAEGKREIDALEKEIASLQIHLDKHKEDLQIGTLKLTRTREEKLLSSLKSCMYRKYSEFLDSKQVEYKSFQKWFDEICLAYHKSFDSDKDKTVITHCDNKIRSICTQLQNSEVNNSVRIPRAKGAKLMWSEVGQLLSRFRPEMITAGVERSTQNSILVLKDEEKEMNLARDVRLLEDNNSSGEEDTSLTTVQNMLMHWDLNCVKIHSQSLNCEKNSREYESQSSFARSRLIEMFQTAYETNPSSLQLIIDNLDAEIAFVGLSGSLKSLQSSATNLESEIASKTRMHKKHLELLDKINNFRQRLETNQVRIISLTTHNSRIKAKLHTRQMEVLECAQSQISAHKVELEHLCEQVKEAYEHRIRAFSQTDMGKLRSLEVSRDQLVPVQQLSFNRYSDISSHSGGLALANVHHLLGIHSHTLPSFLMVQIARNKAFVKEFDRLHERVSLNTGSATFERLKELEKEGVDIEKKQRSVHGKKYEDGLEIIKSAEKQSESLKKLVEAWYECPAQDQCPWLKVDDLSLDQWKKKVNYS